MKKRTRRDLSNDRVQAEAMLAAEPERIQERVRELLAIHYGALRGVIFRLTEKHGAAPHPAMVRAEMTRLFPGLK